MSERRNKLLKRELLRQLAEKKLDPEKIGRGGMRRLFKDLKARWRSERRA